MVSAAHKDLPQRRMIHEIVRRMIHDVVTDLIEETARRLADAKPADIEAVRGCRSRWWSFSESGNAEHLELKKFLRTRLYRHEHIEAQTNRRRHRCCGTCSKVSCRT